MRHLIVQLPCILLLIQIDYLAMREITSMREIILIVPPISVFSDEQVIFNILNHLQVSVVVYSIFLSGLNSFLVWWKSLISFGFNFSCWYDCTVRLRCLS